jgi:DNA invertase Pin-like site-specific DNA recombinase
MSERALLAVFSNRLRFVFLSAFGGCDADHENSLYKGRPATLNPGQIARLKTEGLGPSAIAKRLNIARSSVYRAIGG